MPEPTRVVPSTMAKPEAKAELMEQVLIAGDLGRLTPAQRVEYYRRVCESTGLNWITRPFEYIVLNNRLTLYARRDATDQLRKLHKVSITALHREIVNDICIATASATDATGRTDVSIGAVNVAGLRGEAYANAIMRCETKSKRRVTLSICGLGWLDETEIGTIPDARRIDVDPESGEVKGPPPPGSKADEMMGRIRRAAGVPEGYAEGAAPAPPAAEHKTNSPDHGS